MRLWLFFSDYLTSEVSSFDADLLLFTPLIPQLVSDRRVNSPAVDSHLRAEPITRC